MQVPAYVDQPHHDVVALEDRAAQHRAARIPGRRLVALGEQLGQPHAAARTGRVRQRVPLGPVLPLPRRHVVDCGQRRPRVEDPGGLRVAEVPVLLQVRVDGLLDGPHLGLLGHVPQGREQVAAHLDGPYHAVAVQEQGRTAQPRGVVDLRLGRGVVGEDLADRLLAARLHREGERVPDDAVADAGRGLQSAPGRIGTGRRVAGLADHVEAERAGVPHAAVQRLDHAHVLFAAHPVQERRRALPLAGDQPLGGVLDGLAQLLAEVTGDGLDVAAQVLVRLEELLLGSVVDLHQQDDPQPGAVEHGLGDLVRQLSRQRFRGDRSGSERFGGKGSGSGGGRGGHPAHISFAGAELNVGRGDATPACLDPVPGPAVARPVCGARVTGAAAGPVRGLRRGARRRPGCPCSP